MKRLWTCAACAAIALPLAACGGGGGDSSPRPPITLKGASYDRLVTDPELRLTEGGDGQNVIFVDDGVIEILGTSSGSSGATTFFQADDGSLALVTALPGFESTRLIRLQYDDNGVATVTEGVIGRFTSDAQMATATGRATYLGTGTAEVRGDRGAPGSAFDLSGPDTLVTVEVNFGGQVRATLDFSRTASAVAAPIDTVQIDDMVISGNRFGGGRLTATKSGVVVNAFTPVSPADLSSSGVFTGWNDTTGDVRGGDRPAEVGGAFVATAGVNGLTGRYLAD